MIISELHARTAQLRRLMYVIRLQPRFGLSSERRQLLNYHLGRILKHAD